MDSQAMSSNLLQLKQAMRATWMAGDFGQIARFMEREAEAFVERLGIIPGMKVLDVTCGTGNVAVPAAHKGAQVVGIDIAPNLPGTGTSASGCRESRSDLRGGDAEQLPYPDGHFDLVTSMFGSHVRPASRTGCLRTCSSLSPWWKNCHGQLDTRGDHGTYFPSQRPVSPGVSWYSFPRSSGAMKV